MYKLHPKFHFILGVFMYLFYIIISRNVIELPFKLDYIFKYYIYFSAGYCINHYVEVIRSKFIKYCILIVVPICFFIGIQSIYNILFNLLLIAFIPNKEFPYKLWNNINKNSFAIYLLHHPIIISFFYTNFFQLLYSYHAFTAIVLMFIIAFPISWCMAEGLHKLGFKYF